MRFNFVWAQIYTATVSVDGIWEYLSTSIGTRIRRYKTHIGAFLVFIRSEPHGAAAPCSSVRCIFGKESETAFLHFLCESQPIEMIGLPYMSHAGMCAKTCVNVPELGRTCRCG